MMVRTLCAGLAAAALAVGAAGAAHAQTQAPLECPIMAAAQGGLVICRTEPYAIITVEGGVDTHANADGYALIALARDAPAQIVVRAEPDHEGGLLPAIPVIIDVAAQDYPETRLDNVPRASPSYTEEELAHIRRSTALKREAFGTTIAGADWLGGFILPAEGRRSGVYGSSRVYNGDDANPRIHWGIDIAAPTGTEVIAPAGGTVTLADPDLFFEGGTIFLDHGDGLVSVFMHMSAVDVEAGDVVAQGERLGAIGNTGRSTGPHLHWGLKYQNRFYVDPALALELVPVSAANGSADAAAAASNADADL